VVPDRQADCRRRGSERVANMCEADVCVPGRRLGADGGPPGLGLGTMRAAREHRRAISQRGKKRWAKKGGERERTKDGRRDGGREGARARCKQVFAVVTGRGGWGGYAPGVKARHAIDGRLQLLPQPDRVLRRRRRLLLKHLHAHARPDPGAPCTSTCTPRRDHGCARSG
jgi:hypothetical protein